MCVGWGRGLGLGDVLGLVPMPHHSIRWEIGFYNNRCRHPKVQPVPGGPDITGQQWSVGPDKGTPRVARSPGI